MVNKHGFGSNEDMKTKKYQKRAKQFENLLEHHEHITNKVMSKNEKKYDMQFGGKTPLN